MKDLNYKKAQVFYKGEAVEPPRDIASIYEDDEGLVTVNFEGFGAGSYPLCERPYKTQNILKINNGYNCDEIKLL